MAIPWNIPESSGQFDQKRIQKTIYPFLFSNKRKNFKFFFFQRERERRGYRRKKARKSRRKELWPFSSPFLLHNQLFSSSSLIPFPFIYTYQSPLNSFPLHTILFLLSLSLSLSLSLIIYFLGKPKVSNPHIIIIPFKSTNPFDKNANTIWEIVA